LLLLAHGRLALGTALGHILPEERLAVAARWTGRAWSLASRLDDAALQGHVLRMHGNELRKAGHVPAAIARLSQAAAMTDEVSLRGTTLALLGRAVAEAERPDRSAAALVVAPQWRVIDRVTRCSARCGSSAPLRGTLPGRCWTLARRPSHGSVMACPNHRPL
jgi:hypothetical protein